MSNGSGRSRVEAELADFSPSAVTVRVVQAALGAIPNSQPIPWYATLEQASELVYGGLPQSVGSQAGSVLDQLAVDEALAVALRLDELDRGRESSAGMLASPSGTTEPGQRGDAAIKAHALAYLFAQLLPGDSHRSRVAAMEEVPAARQLVQYFAAVDVAVPFADQVRNADGTFVAALLGAESTELLDRLMEFLGRDGLDVAKDMLQVLLPHLDEAVMQVLQHTPSLATQVRGILPGSFGGTGMASVAADADGLPAYRWLAARLALESSLAAAKLELAPTHIGSASRAMAPDRSAALPNPFTTPPLAPSVAAAAPAPLPPVTTPDPVPIPGETVAEPPASDPSPFVPTFEPAPERAAAPPTAPSEVYDLLEGAQPPGPDSAFEESPEPPPTSEETVPVSQPSEPSGPNPFEPVAASPAEPTPAAEVPPNPFETVEAARDVLEQMAPASELTNGAGAMMLADAILEAERTGTPEAQAAFDEAAEASAELVTVLTAGTTDWPEESPAEPSENPFLPDPDQDAGTPENPFEQDAESVVVAPVDPFAIDASTETPDHVESAPTLVPDSLEASAAASNPLPQPLNPFALDTPAEPTIPVPQASEAPAPTDPDPEPPQVPIGIVTASVAAAYPSSEEGPQEAESPTLIPMPTDAARREVAAAVGSADAPPQPPPTVTPTWPTVELPEEERLRGAYLSTDGKWRIFSKEGIVTTAPPSTVAPIDWDTHWEAGHTIALYKRRGNHATIEYFDAVPESFTVEREPYSLKINGQTWRRADYDLSDRTMRGQWSSQRGSELILDHEGRITKDGRHGRYRLGAGRIEVTWDGGETWVASFLSTLAPSSRHPQVLWLAGEQYTLRA